MDSILHKTHNALKWLSLQPRKKPDSQHVNIDIMIHFQSSLYEYQKGFEAAWDQALVILC